MSAITQKPATDGQKKQLNRFLADVVEKVAIEQLVETLGLSSPETQRVIEHGDELAEDVRTTVIASIKRLSVSDNFKNEEVASNYGYLSGYKPKGITPQTNRLRELFPGIGFANEKLAESPLTPNAEGWFAIPGWDKIAPTYGEAVQKVFDLLKQTRNGRFTNYREGQLGPNQLRLSTKTASAFEKLGEAQKDYDILVVPAQFGLRHRGRSVRRARETFLGNEFGLGAFAIGIMLLTHPERLQDYNDLWIDCAGDEFSPDADGSFSGCPFFYFLDSRLRFAAGGVSVALGDFGSASAFLPQI
jgi:hypothetical protein